MQDDKTNGSSDIVHANPASNEKAEQEARNEENKKEAEQLLKSHRPDTIVALKLFVGIASAYLLLLAAVGALGVIAFYSGHFTTLEIVFFTLIALILIVPIGVIWYLRHYFKKKPSEKAPPGKQTPLDRFAQSSIGGSLLRFSKKRVVRLLLALLYVAYLGFAITVLFPRHPRLSLALITLDILALVALSVTQVAASLEKEHTTDTVMLAKAVIAIYETIKTQNTNITYAQSIAENTRKFIDDTEPSHMEMHRTTTVALNAIQHTLEAITNTVEPDQLDAPPKDEANDR